MFELKIDSREVMKSVAKQIPIPTPKYTMTKLIILLTCGK